MKFREIRLIGPAFLLLIFLSGCATPTDPKWGELESRLDGLKTERATVRLKLTRNPAAPDASVLSEEIANLNRRVTLIERQLSYALSEPVTTELSPIELRGHASPEDPAAIKVAASAWYGLSEPERKQISDKISIALINEDMYGVVMDVQTVNESIAGSNAGSQLGSLLGQSSYIDGSFKNGNRYSATGQVGAGILGAVIGASFNKEAQAIFRARYWVKLANGSLQTTDTVSGDTFRLPLTACVRFPSMDISDQTLCSQTAETLRKIYLK